MDIKWRAYADDVESQSVILEGEIFVGDDL